MTHTGHVVENGLHVVAKVSNKIMTYDDVMPGDVMHNVSAQILIRVMTEMSNQ